MEENKTKKIRTIFPLTSFYAKDSKGAIRSWSITGYTIDIKGEEVGQIKFIFGVVSGEYQEEVEWVYEGLQSRNLEEQILSRINSRIHNKKKSGYVDNIRDAENNKRVNLLGLKRPMLAKKYNGMADKINWQAGMCIQPKLNGERCLINKNDGEITAYSRQGIEFTTLKHITDIVSKIPGDFTLDGELYCHGAKLQTINSWVKRFQPNTLKITYHVYDIMDDYGFSLRNECIKNIFENIKESNKDGILVQVPTFTTRSEQEAIWYRDVFMNDGYEGAMLRDFKTKYQDGKRSSSLIKMKKAMDGEFLVVDIVPSVHGWAILECVTKDGKKFSVSAPGSIDEKTEIYFDRDSYIGRYCKIEFFEWTNDNKPFHPVALGFRDTAQE